MKTQRTVEFCNQQRDCRLCNGKGNTVGKERRTIKLYRIRERETNGQEVQYEKTKEFIKEIKLLKKRDTLINKKERRRGKRRKK